MDERPETMTPALSTAMAPPGLGGRSGLALGMGLDRLIMLVKHSSDIRLLRSGDPRIARQVLDLA
jgi:phenylalanyl-tRNA synthetase alpha chain